MKLGSTSLREGILLSLDICPHWYDEEIIDTVEHYYGTSEYHRPVSDDEYQEIQHIYEYIEGELNNRLKIAQSWIAQQDWVIGTQTHMPAEIGFETTIDHRKFLTFAFKIMGYENEYDQIPGEFKKLKESQEASLKKLSSKDWKILAQLYAKEILLTNPKLILEEVVMLVSKRFDDESIRTTYSGQRNISPPTIKDALSKGGWFTRAKQQIAK